MKFLSTLRNSLSLGFASLALLTLHSQAHAGSWTVEYEHSGYVQKGGINYSYGGPGTYSLQGGIRQIETHDGVTITGDGDMSYVGISWGNGLQSYPGIVTLYNRVPTALTVKGDVTINARLKWHRRQTMDGVDDPNDNPPKRVYVSEHVWVGAYKWSDPSPWADTGVTLSANIGAKDLQAPLKLYYFNNGANSAYSGDDVKIHSYNVPGDVVPIQSVHFKGQIKLAAGYAQTWVGASNMNYGYGVNLVDFGITLSPGVGHAWYDDDAHEQLSSTDPSRIELNAFAQKEWLETLPEDPNKYMWVAGLSPLVHANIAGSTTPAFGDEQNYQWSHDGEGITVRAPEPGASQQEINEQTLPPSTAQKHLRLDLEGQESEWTTKTSTVRVGVTGGTDSSTLPAKVKVTWHTPYTTTFALHVRLQVTMPDGTIVDLGQLGDANLMDDLGSDWRDAMAVGALRTATPMMFGQAGRYVGKLTVEGVIEGILTLSSGGTTKMVRAPLTSEAAREFLRKATPWIDKAWATWTASQALKGLDPGILEATLTVVKVGTKGTSHVQVASDGKLITSLKPAIPSRDIPLDQPLRPENPGQLEDIANDESMRALGQMGGTIPTASNGSPLPPTPTNSINWARRIAQAQAIAQAVNTLTQLRTTRGGRLYYYTQDPGKSNEHWDGASPDNPSRSNWPAGYYYTNLQPSRAAQLTRGEASFCLFGHPYGWDNSAPVYAVPVELTAQDAAALDTRDGGFDIRVPRSIYSTALPIGQAQLNQAITIQFKPGIPGASDVPDGNISRTPVSNGLWASQRGNSVWNSTLFEVREMDAQVRNISPTPQSVAITYSRNYPDFSPWIIGNFQHQLPLVQHGTQSNNLFDFDESDNALAPWLANNFPNDPNGPFVVNRAPDRPAVRRWRASYRLPDPTTGILRNRPLTWHHSEDMRTMQLVPGRGLNNPSEQGVPHDGGGTMARQARW